jgi:hypothetical protein
MVEIVLKSVHFEVSDALAQAGAHQFLFAVQQIYARSFVDKGGNFLIFGLSHGHVEFVLLKKVRHGHPLLKSA